MEQHIKDYEEIFFGEVFCDCDEDTRRLLAGFIRQHIITQEQVEVLWALSKNIKVIKRAAYELDQGMSFPDNDLAELCEWVRKCGEPTPLEAVAAVAQMAGFSMEEVAHAMIKLGQAGLAGAQAGHELRKAMEKLDGITTKGKQNNWTPRVRKKHVFKASDNKGVRPILSKPNRSSHVHKRRR